MRPVSICRDGRFEYTFLDEFKDNGPSLINLNTGMVRSVDCFAHGRHNGSVNGCSDVKKLDSNDLEQLKEELRQGSQKK
jgi:hypothetical protein